MAKRIKTDYPGVFSREAKRIGGKGTERVYYIVFKSYGKVFEEKVGRQYKDNMTPAKAATIRGERIEGKRKSRKEMREEQKARRQAEADKRTIDRLWTEYKAHKPNFKGLTTDQNRYENYIRPNFGDKEPKDLSPFDVDRLRFNLLKKKAPGTVKNVLELLRRIINFGVRKQLCDGITFKIEMPKVNNLKTEDLTNKQLTRLLDAINNAENIQAANMMLMALYTGMRRGELFKLRWEHINFDRGFITIKDPKGGPDQKIPLNDAAKKVLQNHPRVDSRFVFPGQKGNQRADINRSVNKIKRAAGLPKDFRPLHGLRHAYASMLASSGMVDLYTLQKLLTHKSPQMTQRYAHSRDEALKRAANLAGDLIDHATRGRDEAITEKDQTA